MRCFLCKIPLIVPTFSLHTHNQPAADVDERDFAHFCEPCTARLDAAIDDSGSYIERFSPVVGGG